MLSVKTLLRCKASANFHMTVESNRKQENRPKNPCRHVGWVLTQLRARPEVISLKRHTIVLDDDSEKGFGLVSTGFFHK